MSSNSHDNENGRNDEVQEKNRKDSHCAVEQKRRKKVKDLLEDLKKLTPSLSDRNKVDQITLLSEVAKYIRELKDQKGAPGEPGNKRARTEPGGGDEKVPSQHTAGLSMLQPQGMMLYPPHSTLKVDSYDPYGVPNMRMPQQLSQMGGLSQLGQLNQMGQMGQMGVMGQMGLFNASGSGGNMYTHSQGPYMPFLPSGGGGAQVDSSEEWQDGLFCRASGTMSIIRVTDKVAAMLGYTESELLADFSAINLFPPEMKDFILANVSDLLANKVPVAHAVMPLIRKNGQRTSSFYIAIMPRPFQGPAFLLKLKPC